MPVCTGRPPADSTPAPACASPPKARRAASSWLRARRARVTESAHCVLAACAGPDCAAPARSGRSPARAATLPPPAKRAASTVNHPARLRFWTGIRLLHFRESGLNTLADDRLGPPESTFFCFCPPRRETGLVCCVPPAHGENMARPPLFAAATQCADVLPSCSAASRACCLLLERTRHRARPLLYYGKTSHCCSERPEPEHARPA